MGKSFSKENRTPRLGKTFSKDHKLYNFFSGKKKTVYAKMKDELLEDLVDLFVGCNIPIYKLDKPHFRKFLHKHVKNR